MMDREKSSKIQYIDTLTAGRLTAIAGGGGKTACMVSLAGFCSEAGYRVLMTTTTHLQIPSERIYGYDMLHIGNSIPEIPSGMGDGGSTTFWYNSEIVKKQRVSGPDPEQITKVSNLGNFDRIFVEVDGSRGRPLKIPGENEPVIPAGTDTVIGIIGLECLGKPADSSTVHRIDKYQNVTGENPGSVITLETLAAAAKADNGIFKDAPKQAGRILLLNQADTVDETCRSSLAGFFLNRIPVIEAVFIVALQPTTVIYDYKVRNQL